MPAKPRSTARKPALRKTPTSSVLRLDRQEASDEVEAMIADRRPLFEIGDTAYGIPKKAPAAWTLKATELSLTRGEHAALAYVMVTALGEDGYTALTNCPTLTQSDFEYVRDEVLGLVFPGAPKAS